MRTFITGHKGYVGSELLKRGFEPLVCDITNPLEVEKAIKYAKPQLVIHLASKSGVNWCEDKKNEQKVKKVNLRGTYNIFENLFERRIPAVFLSTDQIWRGGFFEQHKEDSRKTPAVNFYAMSKVAAESVVESLGGNIIRTSYLFDTNRLYNHIFNMESDVPKAYPVFIRRSFMYLRDFCDALENYCNHFYKMPKVLHLSGSEVVSWYTFMREMASQYEHDWNLVTPRFREIESPAPRPWFGGLNTHLAQTLGFPRRSYIDGIERMKNDSEPIW